MLRIRLRRTGRKNRPNYRIVVAEHSAPIQGKFVDQLGHFDPRTKALSFNNERVIKWLSVGAQPSNRVAKLLLGSGLEHKLIIVTQRKARAPKKTVKETPKAKQAIEQLNNIKSNETIEKTTEAVEETSAEEVKSEPEPAR